MIIKIIKKKASSLEEVGADEVEIPPVTTLKELLIAICIIEFNKQHQIHEVKWLNSDGIKYQARLGKVSFVPLYNQQTEDLNQAVNTMLQDYQDGLFRVYLNQVECTDLNKKLIINKNDEVVFIRLVMLAGRLW